MTIDTIEQPPADQPIVTPTSAPELEHRQAAPDCASAGHTKGTAQAASLSPPDDAQPEAPAAGQGCITPQSAPCETHQPPEPHWTVVPLMELGWRRTFLIRQRNAGENAAKALIRRFLGWSLDLPEKERTKIAKAAGQLWTLARKDALDTDDLPAGLAADLRVFAQPISLIDAQIAHVEKEMQKLAKETPAAPFVRETPGLSMKGLAILVAEAGDLGSYPDRDRLWKRLGLTPHAGHAYSTWRRGGGDRALTKDEWIAAGYSPRRRSLMFANLFLLQTHVALGTPYAAIYYARKARTETERPDWTKLHRHMDATRVATKALVKDIRKAWRQASTATPELPADCGSPAATLARDGEPG